MSESFICRRGSGGSGATLVITGVAGDTCTISKSGKSKSKTFGSDGKATFKGLDTGTWTVSMTNSSGSTATTTVNITTDYTTSIDYSAIPEYTYSGSSQFVSEDDNENWHLKLLTSGNLNFSKLGNANNIEVFMVGGGAPSYGLHGGGGGYVLSAETTLSTNQSYPCVIGGSGGYTTAFGETAASGNGKNGGSGGGGYGGSWYAGADGGTNGSNGASGRGSDDGAGGTGAGVSTIPWGNEILYGRYSGGGGGGGGHSGSTFPGGAGGAGGGGAGGRGAYSSSANKGEVGAENTGGGGGGCGASLGSTKVAAGGSGIILIRNKRS